MKGQNSKFARTGFPWLFVLASVSLGLLAGSASAASNPLSAGRAKSKAVFFGKVNLLQAPTVNLDEPTTLREAPTQNSSFQKFVSGSMKSARVPSAGVPTPAGSNLSLVNGGFGFDGLNEVDQAEASGVILEPPDQGLVVGGGLVLEAINSAFTYFDPTTGENFFGPGAAAPLEFLAPGLSPTDPKCAYDANTSQWFITYLGLGDRDFVVIAVSLPNDPLDFNVYGIDTTDDGNNGTPSHPGCPCFGDQPLIGSDANAFFVSTNEFGSTFNGSQIYALDKAAIESGSTANVEQFWPGALEEGIAYSVQPATVPPGASFDTNNGGTEYFLSSLDFFGTLDNRIAAWAMTGTSNISTDPTLLTLSHKTIGSEVYGTPVANQQAPGPLPLRDALADGTFAPFFDKEHEELVQSNDDRMNQTVFANGLLWAGLNTVVKTQNGPTRTGIAYFAVNPNFPDGGSFAPVVSNQGYVAVNNQSAIFPSIGVNAAGNGVIAFSVVGPGLYPGSAWARIGTSGVGPLMLAGPGTAPDDGFSGYTAFTGSRVAARWGDYSAAGSDEAGNIWVASEYIPNRPRLIYANFGTFISMVTP